MLCSRQCSDTFWKATGVMGQQQDLAILLKMQSGALLVKHKDGRPEDDLVVHCFCLCRGGVLLGFSWGEHSSLSSSMEHEFLSLLSYPSFS